MSNDVLTVTTGLGDFEVSERDIVLFPRGLPGFERCRRFVLLSHETFAPLSCLHAVDGPDATFLAVDPRNIVAEYECTLQPDERAQVNAEPDAPLVWLVLLAYTGDDVLTANLRAPVVINPASMCGAQFVVDDERYTVRHELAA